MNFKKLASIFDSETYTVLDCGVEVGKFPDLNSAKDAVKYRVDKRFRELDRGINHMFVMNPPADISAYELAKDSSVVEAWLYYKKGATENKVIIKK